MWLLAIRKERRKIEDESGHAPDILLVRPEIMTALCDESGNCPFGILETLDGMIVAASDLLVSDYIFGNFTVSESSMG